MQRPGAKRPEKLQQLLAVISPLKARGHLGRSDFNAMQLRDNWPDGVEIRGRLAPGFEEILTTGALAFIAKLEREFRRRRADCLRRRYERQARLDAGESLDFLSETKHIRDGNWTCAAIPDDLRDRRV